MAYRIRFVHREDFYDIKSTGSFHKSMLLHIQKGCTKNTPLFRASYGLSRRAESRRMARLDLDEEQCPIFLSNDVDLTRLHAKLPFQYAAATLFQIQRRRFFASVTKSLRCHRGNSGF